MFRGEGGDLISIVIGIGIRGRSIVFLPEYMGGWVCVGMVSYRCSAVQTGEQ